MSIDFIWLWWFLTWWSVQPAKKERFPDNIYYAYRSDNPEFEWPGPTVGVV